MLNSDLDVVADIGFPKTAARIRDEIQRLQSLIDEHNRGMDAECPINDQYSDYCMELKSMGESCVDCPRRFKVIVDEK